MNSSSNNDVIYLDESGRHDGADQQDILRDSPVAANADRRLDRESLSKLPATHLIRHFLLFAFAVLFLLTMVRAGYTLWQMDKVESIGVLVSVFLMGLRFDLALVGMLLAVPVFIVPLLAMTRFTRRFGKYLSTIWMILALAAVLMFELLTPYTLQQQGLRPDLAAMAAMGDPVNLLSQLWSKFIIPAVVGIILSILVFVAFIARLDRKRFLRHPIKVIPALCLSILGLAVCIVAATGSANPPGLGFGPQEAQVSANPVINEITMNSTFKTVHSLYSK